MRNYKERGWDAVKKNPARLFFIAYLVAILFGAFLLSMPFSSSEGVFTNYIDTVFTATSAICVTGLVTLVTASYWSIWGKIIIISLIQLGGLGVVTAFGAIGLIINKRFSVRERMIIAEEKNSSSLQGMIKLIKFVLLATFTIEGIGAILLSFTFIPDYGIKKGIMYSIYHAISAFCNAGFDIIGPDSLIPYQENTNVILVISLLIIFGGLGFVVYKDILNRNKNNRLKLHTKLVLISTFLLLFVPTIIFVLIEWNNPETIGNLSIKGKFLSAFFQSVTTRTAGFFSIQQGQIRDGSFLLTNFLMFIGGAPAGTAGGFKITTFLALIFAMLSNIFKSKDVTVFRRRISKDIVEKSLSILMVSFIWIITVTFILTITDPLLKVGDLFYEVISAYGTVGLTRGITPSLSSIGKILVAFTMLFGKIGPIAMVYTFSKNRPIKKFREAEENILVG